MINVKIQTPSYLWMSTEKLEVVIDDVLDIAELRVYARGDLGGEPLLHKTFRREVAAFADGSALGPEDEEDM